MPKRSFLNESLANLRKVRRGEASATQLYDVKDNSVLVSVDEEDYSYIKSSRVNTNFIDNADASDISMSDYEDDGEEFWTASDQAPRRPSQGSKRSNVRGLKADQKTATHRIDDLFACLSVAPSSRQQSSLAEVEACQSLEEQFNGDTDLEEAYSGATLRSSNSFTSGGGVLPACSQPTEPLSLSFGTVFSRHCATRLSQKVNDVTPSATAPAPSKAVSQCSGKDLGTSVKIDAEEESDKETQDKRCSVPESVLKDDKPCTSLNNDEKKEDKNSSPIRVSEVDVAVADASAASTDGSPDLSLALKAHYGEQALLFYFFDIQEEASQLLLYGKVMNLETRESESACIVLSDLYRNVFVRPREVPPPCEGAPVDNSVWMRIAEDVSDELGEVRKQLGIKRWMFRPVRRGFVMDVQGVPKTESSLFVKCVYSAAYQPLPAGLTGKTFTHVFGADTSLTELFIMKRRIMGPSWLALTETEFVPEGHSRLSTCRREYLVRGLQNVFLPDRIPNHQNLLSPPPLTILAMSCQLSFVETETHQKRNEVAMIGAVWTTVDDIDTPELSPNFSTSCFLGIRLPRSMPMWPRDWENTLRSPPSVSLFPSENALLLHFLDVVGTVDPDVLVGHGFIGQSLDILATRLRDVRTPLWYKLSRLRRPSSALQQRLTAKARRTGWDTRLSRFLTVGRLLCDTELQARDLLRSRATFDLPSLAAALLMDPATSCPELLPPFQVAEHCASVEPMKAAALNCKTFAMRSFDLMIKLQMLPLTRELAVLAGHLWCRSLLNLRAERNEFLLLHRFHERKLIKPDRPESNQKQFSLASGMPGDGDEEDVSGHQVDGARKKKGSYTGGLVFEPRVGLYDRFVLLLDFNSLYPSIIQEYNICFTTTATGDDSIARVVSETPGLLPSILRNFVQRRRTVKAGMKHADPKTRASMEIRQLALKLTANSIYGCLGFSQSRFCARPIAALITLKGREALEATRRRVETELRMNIVYGDTDSIMVDTGLVDDGTVVQYQKALELGDRIKRLVNKPSSHLELELDGVFSRLLLLKKKKYACIKVVDYAAKVFEHECKGLDIVRRDWCGLTKKLGDKLLAILFDPTASVDTVVERVHHLLETANKDIDEQRVSLTDFLITKGLNKMPHQYADAKSQPHVQVALRLLESGRPIHPGTEIQYIVCKPKGTLTSIADRAFTLEEITHQGLEVDTVWYKTTQILPPIARLCEHVEGTDIHRLSQCFGVAHTSTPIATAITSQQPPADTAFDAASVDSAQNDVLAYLRCLCRPSVNTELFEKQQLCCPFCSTIIPTIDALKKRQCTKCCCMLPNAILLNWISRFAHVLFSKFGRYERSCSECLTGPTTRVTLAHGLRCPQASCSSSDENTLTMLMTPTDVYALLQHFHAIVSDNDMAPCNCLSLATGKLLNHSGLHTLHLDPILSVLRSLQT